MPTIKRSQAVELMEALGFAAASALSTGRLEKKLNRLDRVEDVTTKDLKDEKLNQLLDMVADAFDAREHISVTEDRPNMPDLRVPDTRREKVLGIGGNGKAKKSKGKRSSPKSQYDWDTILSGKVIQLEQGADYSCKSTTMGMQVRSKAKREGIQVKVSVQKGAVIVQAVR